MTHLDTYFRKTLMPYRLRDLAVFFLSIGLTATAARAAIVDVNGICEIGDCANPGSISLGESIPTTPFSLLYTAPSTDVFQISGTYAASYGVNGGGTLFSVDYIATYQGTVPSLATDTFTVDVFQDIFDKSPGTFDGLYTETSPVVVSNGIGAGTSISMEFLWDGQSVGVLGPYSAPGTYSATLSKELTGLDGDTLSGDARGSFTFGEGTLPGAGASVPSSNATPEPVEALPVAALLLGLCWMRRRQKKFNARIEV